jgi:hypothetical protein
MWSMLVTVAVIYVRGSYRNSCGICATKRVDCGMGSGIPTDSTKGMDDDRLQVLV